MPYDPYGPSGDGSKAGDYSDSDESSSEDDDSGSDSSDSGSEDDDDDDGTDKNAMVTMMAQQIKLLHEQMKLIASPDAKAKAKKKKSAKTR